MNSEKGAKCCTNGKVTMGLHNNFWVPTDEEGNSMLTGDGAGVQDNKKRFTIEEIEVFLIIH